MESESAIGVDNASSWIYDQRSCSSSISSSSSMEPLEEMTTCPIHLGRLEDPKMLHCSHVFCLACLEKWDSQQSGRDRFPCPLCRLESRLPAGGVKALPASSAHQSIINYIIDRQCRRIQLDGGEAGGGSAGGVGGGSGGEGSLTTGSPRGGGGGVRRRKRSLERKQEILTHLAKDFVRRSEAGGSAAALVTELDRAELLAVRENLNKLITRLDDADSRSRKLQEAATAGREDSAHAPMHRQHQQQHHLHQLQPQQQRYPDDDPDDQGGGGSDSSEAEDALDLSFIRHNMKRHSSYKLKEVDTSACQELQQPAVELEIAAAGLASDVDAVDQVDMVLLNSSNRSLLLYSSQDGRLKDFPVVISSSVDGASEGAVGGGALDGGGSSDGRLQCHHMRLVNGLIYVSGVLPPSSPQAAWSSVIVCVQLLDGQVVKRIDRTGGSSEEPLFAGFYVDSRRGDLVVAQPSDQKVEFLSPCLGRTGHWFTFENLHPQYVTWTRERKMLWVSCPREGHILIVNDRTGVYRKLTTTQIFDSVPSHIITTSDRRIIFTDSQRQRLFWVIRRSEFIFVQRLQFPQDLEEITGIAPLGEDKILVSTRRRVFCLKPVRKLRHRKRSKCLIA